MWRKLSLFVPAASALSDTCKALLTGNRGCSTATISRAYAELGSIGLKRELPTTCRNLVTCFKKAEAEDSHAWATSKLRLLQVQGEIARINLLLLSENTEDNKLKLEKLQSELAKTEKDHCDALRNSALVTLHYRPLSQEEAATCPAVEAKLAEELLAIEAASQAEADAKIDAFVGARIGRVHKTENALQNKNMSDTERLVAERAHSGNVSALCKEIEGLNIKPSENATSLIHVEEWCPHLILTLTESALSDGCNQRDQVEKAIDFLSKNSGGDFETLLQMDANCSVAIDRELILAQHALITEKAKARRLNSTAFDIEARQQRIKSVAEKLKSARDLIKQNDKCDTDVEAVDADLAQLKATCAPQVECQLLFVKLKEAAKDFDPRETSACTSQRWAIRFANLRKDIETVEAKRLNCESLVASAMNETDVAMIGAIMSKAAACTDKDLNEINDRIKDLETALGNSSVCDLLRVQNGALPDGCPDPSAVKDGEVAKNATETTGTTNNTETTENSTVGGTEKSRAYMPSGETIGKGIAAAGAVSAFVFRDKLMGMANKALGRQTSLAVDASADAKPVAREGLSQLAIGGILLGVLVVVGLAVGAIYMYRRRQNDYY